MFTFIHAADLHLDSPLRGLPDYDGAPAEEIRGATRRANVPVPFIVDDILITFDDNRAIAALELLTELSDKTQVIFFTHHHRLVELAQKINKPDKIFIQNI